MDLQLKDKVVIVTGGAKGIGAAIVRSLAAEGAIPVIVDRDAEAGKRLQSELQTQQRELRIDQRRSRRFQKLLPIDRPNAENLRPSSMRL